MSRDDYFSKHRFADPQIRVEPDAALGIIVTIPCYHEPDLIRTLDSLHHTIPPRCYYEVIILVNSPEQADENILRQNEQTIFDFQSWKKMNQAENYHLVHAPALPKRHAGVGLARKIAMDEAAWRFLRAGNSKGIIVCLDADCLVDENYLVEIESLFFRNAGSTGCSIYFEHPLEGAEFSPSIYQSILNYELFLRYYILSLRFSGFPFPYHTIGSSMAVRADAYTKQGGMNRRKAGEDFYFLHKLFPLGEFSVLNTTRVVPSPRTSDRVPFGTGADMTKQLLKGEASYPSYHFQSFRDLRALFSRVPDFYPVASDHGKEETSPAMSAFLEQENFGEKLLEIRSHTSTEAAFTKRFFRWFDGFQVLKFVHFARDHFYPNEEIAKCAETLLNEMKIHPERSKKELLHQLRELERKGNSMKARQDESPDGTETALK